MKCIFSGSVLTKVFLKNFRIFKTLVVFRMHFLYFLYLHVVIYVMWRMGLVHLTLRRSNLHLILTADLIWLRSTSYSTVRFTGVLCTVGDGVLL